LTIPHGGRTVLLVNLGYEYIEGAKWEEFLQEQQRLHNGLNEKRAKKPN
jgi:hypothetical protein